MSLSEQIISFAKSSSHHHIVFCREVIPELTFVNVGLELSGKILKEGLDSPMLDFATDDFIQEIMSRHESHPEIGNYITTSDLAACFSRAMNVDDARTAFNDLLNRLTMGKNNPRIILKLN